MTCAGHVDSALALGTATKIKHVVVIFGENISYDHYFGTYPARAEPERRAGVHRRRGTPVEQPGHAARSDGVFAPVTGVDLLNHNPNFTNAANGAGAANPFRLAAEPAAATRTWATTTCRSSRRRTTARWTCSRSSPAPPGRPPGAPPAATDQGPGHGLLRRQHLTALWNYAQNYAMNDNSWTTVFGPSTPGAINLISGQTNGFAATNKDADDDVAPTHVVADGNGDFTMIGDTDPLDDVCSTAGRPEPDDGQEHRRLAERARTSPGAGSRAAST